MTRTIRTAALAALLVTTSFTAFAANDAVDRALKSRSDISMFRDAMIRTGVIDELKGNKKYTIFAPTNASFVKFSDNWAACWQSEICSDELADVLRNHIVEGGEYLGASGPDQKGTLFSVDGHAITIGEMHKNRFVADGYDVLSRADMKGAVLYRINGVIADKQEVSNLQLSMAYRAMPPQVESYHYIDSENHLEKTTTITREYQ